MTTKNTTENNIPTGNVKIKSPCVINTQAKKLLLSATVVIACFTVPSTLAGDIEAGKVKAAICSSCHGIAGVSTMDMWPNLAGQKTAYLAKQIKAFRDGVRKDSVMNSIAIGLSDADIDNMAAYYNSLPAGGG